jgi:hypothetical protein
MADYQCVDFDTGVYPSAWTLTQLGGGTDAISMTQASSPPYSYDAAPFGTVAGIDVARTLSWSKSGTAVTRMDLTADIFRIQSKGDPGPWTGHSDLLCAGFGSTKACLYYAGSAGFGVAYATTGTTRVDCGHIMDLTPGGWNHIELQISSSGSIFLWSNGRVETNCNDGGIGFPSSNIGTVTVGVAQIGETLPLEHYFDNIIAVVRR